MPRADLTSTERKLRARIAGLTFASNNDVREHMKAAQAASPGQLAYWEHQVDPDRTLNGRERRRRAKAARSAHMARLALEGSKARRQRKKAS